MVIMLTKKMFRDIRKNLSQFITIFLMVMIGVMAYAGIEAYMGGMKDTADKFYSENNLQEFNIQGPLTDEDLNNIKKIAHVNDAERKLQVTGTTDDDKTLLISFIESNNISKFYLIDGEEFEYDKVGVYLDADYANLNNIHVGDTITVKYDTLNLKRKVLALVNVPDHLYDVKDSSELYPDKTNFGFAYLSLKEINEEYIKSKIMKENNIDNEKLFDYIMPDFNYKDYIICDTIMVDIDNNDNRDKVKEEIEDKIDNAKALINIEDTSSYMQYQGEIDEGKTYVGVFSGLFLFIAMLSVITTMTRIVKNQRIQIGTLKALGYSNNRILLHYISYGFIISFIASILGLIVGYYTIGSMFIKLEMDFFEIPNGAPSMNPMSYVVALITVLLVCIISYLTCRSILKENTAETLRNKIPSVKNGSLNITNKGIFKKLSFSTKWNIRDIIRNKMRTFMAFVGVTGCAMLIVCALGMLDSMNFFIELQFERIFNFDYKLALSENITDKELNNLYDLYGTNTSMYLGIETKIDDEREANNIFVTDANDYVRFVDNKNNIKDKPSDDGVYITYKLAKNKNLNIGDDITWHIYGDSEYHTSKIVGFNKDPQNQNLSMTRAYLESLNIEYKPDSLYTNINLSNIKEIDGVEVIQDINALKDGMNSMLSMMKTMLVLIISIAVLLGTIIIYNLGILSYTEKQYQFATLKVLGFEDKKIRKIFIKQNNWIAIISAIAGCPFGFYLTDYLFKVAIEEHYDFAASIRPITYVIGLIGTFIVSYVVSRFLSRKIKDIDMVTSLKGNE